MKKTILLTGGAGYIGSHTAVALHDAGFHVVIMDNNSNSAPDAIHAIRALTDTSVRFFRGDCTRRNDVENVFARCSADGTPICGIIHFAAHKAVGESVAAPLRYYRNNILSLTTVLEVAAKYAHQQTAPCAFIFSSSATVYGDVSQENLPLTEDLPRRSATNPYGNTKIIGEDIVRDVVRAHLPFAAIALRYFNPIGAHPSAHIGERPDGVPANLVPYLMQAAAGLRDALTIFGDDYPTPDGSGIRDYIHVCDVADAHVAALKHALTRTAPHWDVFNIGTGRGTSVLELIRIFEEETSVRVPTTIGPRRPGDVAACYAGVEKAARILEWRARYTIADALRHAWAWEQKNRNTERRNTD